ncbi:hypothetical protein [Alteromonas australica]|uniref:hypothetical protein n=1 Tax=Alteromonas australica TaxID=589873 RepID=UPI0035C827C2
MTQSKSEEKTHDAQIPQTENTEVEGEEKRHDAQIPQSESKRSVSNMTQNESAPNAHNAEMGQDDEEEP